VLRCLLASLNCDQFNLFDITIPTLVYYCVSSSAVIGTQFIELENVFKNFPKVLLA